MLLPSCARPKNEAESQCLQLVWRSTSPRGMQVSTSNVQQVSEKGAHPEGLWESNNSAILYGRKGAR